MSDVANDKDVTNDKNAGAEGSDKGAGAAADAQPPKQPTAGNAGQAGGEAKFTQADVDRIVGERAKSAKSAERAALLAELGVTDVDAVKKAMAEVEKARKDKMTEAERAAAERADLQKRLAEAEAAKTDAEKARFAALLEAEVVSLASGRFANPKAAVKLADLSKVELKDGKFVGVAEALDALAAAEPWTLAQNAASQTSTQKPPSIGTTNGKPGGAAAGDKELRARFFGGGGTRLFEKKSGGVVQGR